jgi:hypothetical protein
MVIRPVVVAVLLAGMGAPWAQAQSVNRCIDECFSTFSPSENNGSTELRDECLQQCKAPSGPSVPYGAIAFGPRSGSWGTSYRMGSQSAANRSALARCREQPHGADCTLAAGYAGTCAAVAAVTAKGRFATGQGRSVESAKAAAMRACQTEMGGACQLWVYSCATDNE